MPSINRINVTPSLRQRLSRALAKQPVVLAYLFGSALSGRTHEESDVDVALYFEPHLTAGQRLDAQVQADGALAEGFTVNSDLINTTRLNDAPHLLRYVAISEGAVLFERSRSQRLDFELRVLQEEEDQRPYRRANNAEFLRRLAAGTV